MPYANNEGIRVHYQVEGNGPPLVLHHGFGGFLETWYDIGYVDALKDDYQLILMDARGCGASDKPHDREAYRLELRVADVVAILDDLGLSKAHFFGYSMGGYIGWGIARYAPTCLLSLVIGGAGPNKETWDESEAGPGPMQEALKQGIDAWSALVKAAFGRWWQPQWETKVLASDLEALIATASRWETIDPDRTLPSLTVPCLIFAGEQDDAFSPAKEASEIIPNATFLSLPDLDHGGTFCRIDLVVPHMRKFLAEAS